MSFKIREFNPCDAEYEAIASLRTSLYPHMPTTAEEIKFDDNNFDPKYMWKRFVVECGDQIVAYGGYADAHWTHQPGKYWIGCRVAPRHQGQGLGKALYDFLMEDLEPRNPMKLITEVREDDERAVVFAQKRGFRQTMRFATSELDLTTFDVKPFQHLLDSAKAEGVEILSLIELKEKVADWKEKLYDLRWEILKDVPSPDPLTKDTLDQWERQVLNNPRIFPESWMIALDGDRFVGYSNMWKIPANPNKLDTGLTGVVRTHRRKGVCTAMKIRAFDAAKAYGAKIIETENEENNPMYQINMRLGFRPRPAWLAFERIFDEGQ